MAPPSERPASPDDPTVAASGNPALAGRDEADRTPDRVLWAHDADATVIVDAEVRALRHQDRDATVIVAPTHPQALAGAVRGAADAPTLRLTPELGSLAEAPSPLAAPGPPSSHAASGGSGKAADPMPPAGVRYVVLDEVGKGGMGIVHLARDVDLLRRVALKELAPDVAGHHDARARFVREVQVTAQLDHPHIVPVYGLEVAEGGRPAYAMKLVEGRTFADVVRETRTLYDQRQPLDSSHALHTLLEYFLRVCDAVNYAHERGVVHRDLKPANLMVGSHNEVYVMDWGLCRLLAQAAEAGDPVTAAALGDQASHGDGSATVAGAIVGTPRYMSPEQARGRTAELDPRSDQYSLGLILQELVTLKPPVAGSSALEILARAAEPRREPVVHAYDRPIPGELVAIIDRATAPEPSARYPSVRAFADDLRRFMRGDAVEARPDSPWQKVVRLMARHRQTVAIGTLALVAVSMAAISFLLWRHDRAIETRQAEERQRQAFLGEVARRGDHLQARLLDVRADFEAFVGALAQAAEHGAPSDGDIPWWSPTTTTTAVADDTQRAVFVRSSGGDVREDDALARRLLHTQAALTALQAGIRHSLGERPGSGDQRETRSGLRRMDAVFASGLQFQCPPPVHQPQGDPRGEAWYQEGLRSDGLALMVAFDGDPAQADDARAVVIAPVRGEAGRLLGVVRIVLDLDEAIVNLLADHPLPMARAAVLVDAERRVLAQQASAGADAREMGSMLRDARFQRALEASEVGTVELEAGDRTLIAAFDRIHPSEWTFVVVADRGTVIDAR